MSVCLRELPWVHFKSIFMFQGVCVNGVHTHLVQQANLSIEWKFCTLCGLSHKVHYVAVGAVAVQPNRQFAISFILFCLRAICHLEHSFVNILILLPAT